jgi:hypothetical protein
MMLHTIIIEICNARAREFRAIGATRDIRLLFRARPHGALAAEDSYPSTSNTTIAQQIFLLKRHLPATELLHDCFGFLLIFFLRGEIHGTGAAIKAAGSNQAFSASFNRFGSSRSGGILRGRNKRFSQAGHGH